MKLLKQYRIRNFVLMSLTLTLFLSSKTYAQKSWLTNFANPNNIYYMGSRSALHKKIPLTLEMVNSNHFADSVLQISPIPWLKVDNPDKIGEKMIYVRRPSGRIRAFQPLINQGTYLILCSRGVEDPCMCRNNASLYLYIPEQNLLKLVEKAFTFSLKRNLISRLNKYAKLNLTTNKFENICKILKTISTSS